MNTKKKLLIGLIMVVVVLTAFLAIFYIVNLPSQKASEWYHQGHVCMDQGKYEDAIECFDKVLEIEPDNRAAVQFKAYTLVNLGRYDEALNCYDEFVSRIGGYQSNYSAPFCVMRGHILLHLERYEEAYECFEKALEREDINKSSKKKYKVYGLLGKGLAAAEYGEYMYSQQCLDEALEILESGHYSRGIPTIYGGSFDEVEMEVLIYYFKGCFYVITCDYYEAVEYLDLVEQSVKPRPVFADADANNWYNKGKVLLETGHKEEAYVYFENLGALLTSTDSTEKDDSGNGWNGEQEKNAGTDPHDVDTDDDNVIQDSRINTVPIVRSSPTKVTKPTPTTSTKGPDLEVTDVRAVGVRITLAGSDYVPDINVDVVKVTFTVKNIGDEAVTEKFYTEIYVAESNKIEEVETAYLGPGESFTKTVSFRATFAALRVKPVIVKVDADNAISELDEENNIKKAIAAIIS